MKEIETRTRQGVWTVLCASALGLFLAGCGQEKAADAGAESPESAAPAPLPTGEATATTRQAQQALLQELPFDNREDFEDAKRGFITTQQDPEIKDADGNVVWRLNAFDFIGEDVPAPENVNPSLWRQSQLVRMHGVYEVTEKIYQVRGYDLSNVTFIRGNTGWIVIDPLISQETAAAALALVKAHVEDVPVVAVVHTHSHVDHFGGVRGVVDEADVRAGRVPILAPDGFLEHAISENVIAGNAMSRRASYMYGNLLPTDPTGQIGAGLGQTTSTGTVTIIRPTDTITQTGEERTVDGVRMVFVNAPNSEAPSEMMFYFPDMKALCSAEDVTHTLHNLYTLRGAKVRDPLAWSNYLQEVLNMFGADVEVMFASHHWPRWGNARIVEMIRQQHDMYKYLHDQTVRLMNMGYTMIEIGDMVELPPELGHQFHDRGYYGTVNHDVKAVYQRYLGFFDGNPATLHRYPPVEASRRYVEFMGGADEVLRRARESFEEGDYRWVAEVVNHVVFADPDNTDAKALQAAALEQMGFQAESGPWRNFYLSGAQELREGVREVASPATASPDFIANMTLDNVFDYLAIHVDPEKAHGKNLTVGFTFTDTNESLTLYLRNSTMSHAHVAAPDDADAKLTMTRATLNSILTRERTVARALASGDISVSGNPLALHEMLGVRDTFPFWFNIVTP